MRKACGALLLLLGAVIPSTTWADNARDDTVNHGNAQHLGAVDSEASEDAGTSAVPLNDGEVYTELGGVISTGYVEHSYCGECGEPSPCGSCQPQSGTLEFFGPIAVINQHPPNIIFLSPVPEVATVLGDGESYLRIKLEFANHLIRELDSGVIADYDFETERIVFDYHEGRWGGELSTRVPLIWRNHGFLDSAISDWHGLFGMPNEIREARPGGMYRFVIATRDGLVFNEEGDAFGLGDIAVAFKRPVFNRGDGREALSWRVALKAPTGDPDHAFGSGNWDTQLGLLYQRQLSHKLRGYVNLDYVFVGEPDWDNIAWQDIPATLWGLEYALDGSTTAVAQYSTHRNALRVGSFEADKDSQDLALGFNQRLNDNMVFTGGFMEDINPETSVDFLVMAHLKLEF